MDNENDMTKQIQEDQEKINEIIKLKLYNLRKYSFMRSIIKYIHENEINDQDLINYLENQLGRSEEERIQRQDEMERK